MPDESTGLEREGLTLWSLVPTHDTAVDSWAPSQSFGSDPALIVDPSPSIRAYGLIRWAASSGPPPAGSTVVRSRLFLHATGACSGQEFELRRIPAGWSWSNSNATWQCLDDQNGSAAGCGSGAAASWNTVSQVVATATCDDDLLEFDIANDMQQWVDSGGTGGSPNGYLVASLASYPVWLDSIESGFGPQLELEYEAPGSAWVPTLPPAPPLDVSTPTTTYAATRFLWQEISGPPVQFGLAPNAIHPDRAAHVFGRIRQFDGSTPGDADDIVPLAGVDVSVLNRPEFGRTRTRADGAFDLVFNGGGPMTLVFRRGGFLEAQRSIEVGWGEEGAVDDVVMLGEPSGCSQVLNASWSGFLTGNTVCSGGSCTATSGSPWTVVDSRGTRSVAFYVRPGTQVTHGSGSVSQWRLCYDEFTRAVEDGSVAREAAMPADIATNTGYTYAAEGQVRSVAHYGDPGVALEGAHFTNAATTADDIANALMMYVRVDDFENGSTGESMDFAAGALIPFGTYDRTSGAWIPGHDGTTVQVAKTGAGACTVRDTMAPESGAWPESARVVGDERAGLCAMVPNGATQRFWRVPVEHFSPVDCNVRRFLPDVDPEALVLSRPCHVPRGFDSALRAPGPRRALPASGARTAARVPQRDAARASRELAGQRAASPQCCPDGDARRGANAHRGGGSGGAVDVHDGDTGA